MPQSKIRVLSVFGTRPEVIKMAPVHRALSALGFDSRLCVTGQHRHLLDQALDMFDLRPHHDLDVMTEGQELTTMMARLIEGVGRAVALEKPDAVLVQGDTASALAGALAGFYAGIPVGHVEAGLRTEDWRLPFPEEVHRRAIDGLATWCFAPTEGAAKNLGYPDAVPPGRSVWITGNTVVDALHDLTGRLNDSSWEPFRELLGEAWSTVTEKEDAEGGPVVLVTVHRRETLGQGLGEICDAILNVAAERPDVRWLWPVHPNPAVRSEAHRRLGGKPGILLLEPVPYDLFVRLMSRSTLILTDSGGVQEEAPSLGCPVLVARDLTERHEGLAAGVARLGGTRADRLARELGQLLDDPELLASMSAAENPYGDGQAATRIARILSSELDGAADGLGGTAMGIQDS